MNNDWREYTGDDSYELYHHGILGQKWGVRRFQNADGSLTAKGRKRYDEVDPEIAKNKVTKRAALDYHNMNDLQFMAKYKTTKKKFAKRYAHSKGDTYTLGKRKAAIAAYIVAKSGPVKVHTIYGTKTIKMGKAAAAKALTYDISTSQLGANIGYKKAEKKYEDSKKSSTNTFSNKQEMLDDGFTEDEIRSLYREMQRG